MNANQHAQEAQRFLQHAELFLVESDSLARAEMFWCAAAHIVKALAVQRGWDNNSHNDLFNCAFKMKATIGYQDAPDHFGEADRLHKHMYHGLMKRRALNDAETTVRNFINRIADAVSADAPDDAMPPAQS